ncbi:enoyl-CoA hydratase/isomerase family protein [Nakamurella sp. YIM 132087]|uniref:Enoyl-CoA hydratase/isomerase family protein n=1 Tax=Nakamurella alba TaxID=2665158 RepID=A0A7K1FSG4_9ACTN|nr:enoyl-CoA hydratase/isomerase family protein [Nakamurella alba]MTD16329.1 enoyl-CoA hydratase/isomerase family protein [Nakamurella alba]
MPAVELTIENRVAHIRLNRPEASNAISIELAHDLGAAVVEVAASDARAVLLTAAGARFCAGGDLGAMVAADDQAAFVHELAVAADRSLLALEALPVPVIAAVHGSVAGAGLAVMLSCDLILAARSTKFLSAYSQVGLTPDCGLSYLLPRSVGQTRALELLLTDRRLTAEEAHAWGMVTTVVEDDDLTATAIALAAKLTGGVTGALASAKDLIRARADVPRADMGLLEATTISRAVTDAEAQQRISAFFSR